MMLFEYEAKEIFRKHGINVPKSVIVQSPTEVGKALQSLSLPVAIKAQVLVGGRERAGGIKFANSLEEASEKIEELMRSKIEGKVVNKILVEEKVDAKHEYYLGITTDQLSGKPIVMVSLEGGVDIEDIAKEKPETIIYKKVSLSRGFFQFEARNMCQQLGLSRTLLQKVSDILYKLYRVFDYYDAVTSEINPLTVTKEEEVYAVDAKLEIDDNSIFRHPDIDLRLDERFEDEIEKEAIKNRLSYVKLDGNIGVIGSGAGLTMATVDLIEAFGGKPANFLETGGGITDELMEKAVEIVLKDRRLKALLINLYGGINPMVDAAKGIVKAYKKLKPNIPIRVKLIGNQQEEAWSILETAGILVVKEIQTEVAVKKLISLLGEQ